MTVREAEGFARRIAFDRVRKKEHFIDPDIVELENRITESLGARVQIERRPVGGKLVIDFSNTDDLRRALDLLAAPLSPLPEAQEASEAMEATPEATPDSEDQSDLYSIKNFSL